MTKFTVTPFDGVRLPDWNVQFVHFIKDSQDIGADLILDWDTNSCASWVCDGIQAMTGKNPHDQFPTYNSALGAAKAIKDAGFKTFDELLAFLFPEIPMAFVTMGDVVLVDAVLGEGEDKEVGKVMPYAMALADPPHYWLVDPKGFSRGPLTLAKKAYAIGRVV